VLGLLKGRRVSLREASRRLSPKCSLLEPGVRTYVKYYALALAVRNMISNTTSTHLILF
jgi:hypothetical protein